LVFSSFFRVSHFFSSLSNNHYLALSCLEFYGILQLYPLDGRDEARKAASLAAGFRGQTVEDVRSYQQELKDGGGPKKVAGGMLPEAQRAHEVPHQQAALMPPVASQSVSPLPVSLPSVPQSAVPAGAGGGSKFGPPPYRPFEDGMEFIYQQDLDANGILYWLGTQRWTRPWQNPAELGVVQVTSVPLAVQPKSEPASAIVGRSLCRCVTLPNRESWFIIDLINVWVRPTAYTLRHYDSFDTEALRDWKLQGSNDGKKWTKLLSHKKDESLNAKGESHTWAIPKPKKSYRMFRILQTGKNSKSVDSDSHACTHVRTMPRACVRQLQCYASTTFIESDADLLCSVFSLFSNHWYCALSSIELYGKVYSYKR
jgi:hypothetical protein